MGKKEWNKTPTRAEGAYIQFLLKLKRVSCSDISFSLSCGAESVLNVVAGRRHSARIEAEIASVLGYESWNDMILSFRKDGIGHIAG